MSETGFWWSHWGHLATKPLQALAIFLPLHFLPFLHLPATWAALAALALPALYSAVRKQRLWPGCFTHLDVWLDEFVDTWAAATAIVPFLVPWSFKLIVLAVGVIVLWPLGLHKRALP